MALGWFLIFNFRGRSGKIRVPSLHSYILDTGWLRDNWAHTHPLSGPHGGAVIFQPHSHRMPLQGQPGRRAPFQRQPSPRAAPTRLPAPTHRSRPRGWVSGSQQGSEERARPHPRPPHSRAHTGIISRRAHAAHKGAGIPHPGHGLRGGWRPPVVQSGARSRVPRGRRRPPRPAPLRPSNPPGWARRGLQSFAAQVSQGSALARARLCSTTLGRQ